MGDPVVLAVIGEDDVHRGLVGLPADRVVWLDPARIPSGVEVSFDHLDGVSEVSVDGRVVRPTGVWWQWSGPEVAPDGLSPYGVDARELLRRLRALGERPRTSSLRFEETVLKLARDISRAQSERVYAGHALQAHLRDLRSMFPDARWVNPPFAADRARSKPAQLRWATAAGLPCPLTRQTPSGPRARAFARALHALGHQIVCKDVTKACPRDGEGSLQVLWTTLVEHDADVDWDALWNAPKVFQQRIADGAVDIRVTNVDQRVFAAEILIPDGLDMGVVCDHRALGQAGPFADQDEIVRPYQLPRQVEVACRAIHEESGAVLSAIDLMRDRDGTYWFLDLNVENVAFAWIEWAAGYPIGRVLRAALLADARR